MRSEALLLYFTLLQIAGAGFPEDSEPISISHGNCKYILTSSSLLLGTVPPLITSPPSLSPCTLFPLRFVFHVANPPSQYLSHLFYPFCCSTSLSTPCFPLQPPPPLHWIHFEGTECNLAPKDSLSTHTKMKDLKQHLKRSPPHIKG